MDIGLGVQWPLSPYATALAAGAFFAFCFALWKHRLGTKKRTGKDPSGHNFGKDLDPKKQQDECEKPGKKERERESEGNRNFPVLALRDITRRFNYEPSSLSGQFGAIPRNLQRDQTLENPNLHAVAQRRNVKEENKNWQEVNTASPSFACIYQQSLSLASELPRLNARFLLNFSPYIQPYIKPIREIDVPETFDTNDFEKFDIAIRPEILKNKPITRTAVSLALHRQLHRFLEEPFREIRFNERAIQTVEISEEDEDESGGASGNSIQHNLNLISENNELKSEDSTCPENSNLSSLWDSGYGEKVFEDSCTTPKKHKDDSKLNDEYYNVNVICSPVSENLNSEIFDDINSSTAITINDSRHTEEESDNFRNILKETCDHDIIGTKGSENQTKNPCATHSDKCFDDLTVLNYSNLTREICDDSPIKTNQTKNQEVKKCCVLKDNFCNTKKFSEEVSNLSLNEPCDISSDSLNSTKDCKSQTGSYDNYFTEDSKNHEYSHQVTHSELSAAYSNELNINLEGSNSEFTDIEISQQEIKNLCFEENLNGSDVTKYSKTEIERGKQVTQKIGSNKNNYFDAHKNNDLLSESEVNIKTCTFEEKSKNFEKEHSAEKNICPDSDLEQIQNTVASRSEENQRFNDEFFSPDLQDRSVEKKNLDSMARTFRVDVENAGKDESSKCLALNSADSDLERIQNIFDRSEEQNNHERSAAEDTKLSEKRNYRLTEITAPSSDVMEEGSSRDSAVLDEKETFNLPRQMDRETGERSVAVESTVTTETTLRGNGETRLSTAVVSRLTLDEWSAGSFDKEDSVSVKTTVSEEVFRPTFEEFVPLESSENVVKKKVIAKKEILEDILSDSRKNGNEELSSNSLPSSPRVDRLKGLINRDEERRSRTKFQHLADSSHVGGAMEGEWDRLLRDVLASVSELERWERRHCDVSSDAEDAEQQHHFSQSDSSFTMEEGAVTPKGETPTKVKSLRFKLDPDIFDVPSDDSFYDDEDEDEEYRRGWKKQSKYRTFSSLELKDEPVKLVSVHASVVPAGQKMVARPVGIDLRVRLTEERQSKRAHVSTSPSQAKRRSPVSDRGIGWCQELSPVTENVDWRETFTPVATECKTVPNGILKTPSPKIEPSPIESPNPFKQENCVKTNGVTTNGVTTNGVTTNGVKTNGVKTNGVSPMSENKRIEKPKYNGWKPPIERKPFLIIRKKFEPDPEAIERITGYRSALSKPPLPPPFPHKNSNSLIARNKAEIARKQYLDNKAALANSKIDSTKKFQQFLNQTQNDRAKIVTSVPDLVAIERAVTEQWTKERKSVSPRESPGREDNKKTDEITFSRGNTPDDKWASYVQSCRQHLGRRSQSMTYLETDIDIIPVLDEDDKCHSISVLDEPDEALPDPDDSDLDRSREDLDDSGRAKSEHELRIERSLRSLPVPDWYRRSDKTKSGFLLGSSNKEKRGWAAIKSLASSTSSLASCGLRRPITSLRSSRENIPWSRSSASPDGPTLSLALAKAFREPYLGWRARTPTSSGVSSSPHASPPSWNATTTTTDDEANGVSFDGEDAFGRTTSSEDDRRDEPLSLDDTGADAVTVSMDTNDPVKLPGGEDTCDDINNMSMDTCELFDVSVVVPVDEDPSPQVDTGDDIDNLSTDTTTTEGRKLDPKLKRYSYSQSIYHSEWDEEEESRGDKKGKEEDREPISSSPDHKVVWIESSFVGSRTTTSIMVLPEKNAPRSTQERPASR